MHFQLNRAKLLWVAPPKLIYYWYRFCGAKTNRHFTDGRLRLVDIFSNNNLPYVLLNYLLQGIPTYPAWHLHLKLLLK